MLTKLLVVKNLVHEILIQIPETRASDKLLIIEVYKKLGVPPTSSLGSVFTNPYLPTFESIGRARRKCQELHPELRPPKINQQMRLEMEQNYREFAKEAE